MKPSVFITYFHCKDYWRKRNFYQMSLKYRRDFQKKVFKTFNANKIETKINHTILFHTIFVAHLSH